MATRFRFQDDARALAWTCPTCGAGPDQPCNTPTETGRQNVRWLHLTRTDKLADMEESNGTTTTPEP